MLLWTQGLFSFLSRSRLMTKITRVNYDRERGGRERKREEGGRGKGREGRVRERRTNRGGREQDRGEGGCKREQEWEARRERGGCVCGGEREGLQIKRERREKGRERNGHVI